eukprot:82947-Chlamydomonas_euryale.AAC.4
MADLLAPTGLMALAACHPCLLRVSCDLKVKCMAEWINGWMDGWPCVLPCASPSELQGILHTAQHRKACYHV